jgi:hypothetical protein
MRGEGHGSFPVELQMTGDFPADRQYSPL